MLSACLAGTFPTLKVGIFLYHIGVKIVLPLCEIRPVANDFLSAQAIVFCQRNKCQLQMWRFLVHVYHCRHDNFPTYPLNEKVCCPLENRLYFLWGLFLEKFRAGGYERVHKAGAVLAGAANCLFDTPLNKVVVSVLRLYDMEVVLAPAGVNVGIAGVLLFLPFVMGFQRSCWIVLVLFKSQNCVLCHSTPFPIPFLSVTFPQENPTKIISNRLGME